MNIEIELPNGKKAKKLHAQLDELFGRPVYGWQYPAPIGELFPSARAEPQTAYLPTVWTC